jgi:hypothetical protein
MRQIIWQLRLLVDGESSIRGEGVSPAIGFSWTEEYRALRAVGICAVALALGGGMAAAQAQESRSAISVRDLPDAPGFVGEAAGGQAGPAAPATIEGTIVDPNGDVVEGARVALSGPEPGSERTAESRGNGQFIFTGLAAETYTLKVTAPGMGTVESPEVAVRAGETRFLPAITLPVSAGVTEIHVRANEKEIEEEEAEQDVHIEESQRVLGVVPNFYSAFDWNAPPLNARQKFQLAFRSEIDPITILGAAAIAGGEEYKKIYSGYGSEVGGFSKRFAAQYTNDFDSRMIGSALLPSLFHQDPRYFYKGTGTIKSRAWYAIRSAFICRGDNGKPEFDFSHIGGDLAAGALSNLYYPESNEGTTLVFTSTLIEIGGMAGTDLIREFVLPGLTKHVGIRGDKP